jgi:hypothetical protein
MKTGMANTIGFIDASNNSRPNDYAYSYNKYTRITGEGVGF